MIRVLSILHVAVCMPMRWLTGNTEDLEGFDFSMLDMGAACELLEHAMVDVAETPELFLDEDFMMNIFSDLKNKVDPFADYLNYMFTEKSSHPIGGSRTQDDKVLPYDILIAELFYPVRNENRQTHNLSIRLGELIADTMLIELRDKSKNTWEYLSSCDGRYSKKNITENDRQETMGIMSHNSISESNHAAATFSLKTGGTIRINHSCAEDQTRMNKDFNRGHMAMVTGKVSTSGTVDLVQGTYHHLRKELKESLVEAARKNAKQTRKWFDDAMKTQREK